MKPADIRSVGDQELLISWEDGHRSLYAYSYLRLNCPCAGCRNEWTGERVISPDRISKDIKLANREEVGNYAVRFIWSDGHQTGIYGFDYLRTLCPCKSCNQFQKS